jgi:cell division transport system permease protein
MIDKLAFLLAEGLKNLWRHKLTALSSIFSIFITMFLVGSLFIALRNSHHLIEYLRTKYKIEVFFDDQITDEQARELTATIRTFPGVRATTLITKKDALRIFQDQFGEDIIAMLGYNPLPASCVVNIVRVGEEPIDMEPLIRQIKALKGVDQVNYQGRLIRRIETLYQQALRWGTIGTILVLLLTVVILSNTIKLTVYAKRDLIKAMRLIGATNLFIKTPFLLESLFQGVIGAALAYLVIIALVRGGNVYLQRLLSFQIQLDPYLAFILIGVAVVISLLGGNRAVTKFL